VFYLTKNRHWEKKKNHFRHFR